MACNTPTPSLWTIELSRRLDEHIATHREFAGRYVRFPIQLSPEARARRDWDDAIAWLEAREAARREWPWPERD
jgi:hypothetical protein